MRESGSGKVIGRTGSIQRSALAKQAAKVGLGIEMYYRAKKTHKGRFVDLICDITKDGDVISRISNIPYGRHRNKKDVSFYIPILAQNASYIIADYAKSLVGDIRDNQERKLLVLQVSEVLILQHEVISQDPDDAIRDFKDIAFAAS